jgi:hypothetical protein
VEQVKRRRRIGLNMARGESVRPCVLLQRLLESVPGVRVLSLSSPISWQDPWEERVKEVVFETAPYVPMSVDDIGSDP